MKKYTVVIIALFATVFCAVWLLTTINSRREVDARINLVRGWDVTINEKQYHDVSLRDFSFDVTGIGDVVTLKRILPQSAEHATIRFWICHCAIDAYMEDELFYTYGHELVAQYRMAGSGFHFIELPADYAGKELTIRLEVGEKDAFASFDPIYIEGSNTVFTSFLSDKFLALIVGIFLLVLGLTGMILASFMLRNIDIFQQLIHIFYFSMLVGLWTLCNNGIVQLFCKDYVIPQTMEFVSLFLAEIPFLCFMLDITKGNKIVHKLNRYLIIGAIIFDAVVFFAVVFGIAHFQAFLAAYHILLGLTVVDVLGGVYVCIKSKKRAAKYIVLGCVSMVLGVVLDIASFNLTKYAQYDPIYIDFGSIIGSLIVVDCLVISYFVYIKDKIVSSAETEVLQKLAYHDILTGALNRVKFEEILDQMDEGNFPYAIMYFDLNGLKKLNDTEGHTTGDLLIQEFTKCLNVVFQEKGQVARLGGDEFAVVLFEVDQKDIENYVGVMQKYIKQHNANSDVKLDAAFGVAFHYEASDRKSRTVCKLADARMYAMKRKMKTARE